MSREEILLERPNENADIITGAASIAPPQEDTEWDQIKEQTIEPFLRRIYGLKDTDEWTQQNKQQLETIEKIKEPLKEANTPTETLLGLAMQESTLGITDSTNIFQIKGALNEWNRLHKDEQYTKEDLQDPENGPKISTKIADWYLSSYLPLAIADALVRVYDLDAETLSRYLNIELPEDNTKQALIDLLRQAITSEPDPNNRLQALVLGAYNEGAGQIAKQIAEGKPWYEANIEGSDNVSAGDFAAGIYRYITGQDVSFNE